MRADPHPFAGRCLRPRPCLRVTTSTQAQQACAALAESLPSCSRAVSAPLPSLGNARAVSSWHADAPTGGSEPSWAGDVSNVVAYGNAAADRRSGEATTRSPVAPSRGHTSAAAAAASSAGGVSAARAEASAASASGAVRAAGPGAAAQPELVVHPPPGSGSIYGGSGMAGSFPMPPLILPEWASEARSVQCQLFTSRCEAGSGAWLLMIPTTAAVAYAGLRGSVRLDAEAGRREAGPQHRWPDRREESGEKQY